MMFFINGIALTLLAGVGAFALGRLTVFSGRVQNIVFRKLLFLGIALAGICVATTPGIYLGFAYFEELQSPQVREYPGLMTELLHSISFLVYWAVVYLSFRMGTGRVRGTG